MASDKEVLTLEVATPTGLKLRTDAEDVSAPSVDGEFDVLPGHLPLLAALRSGVLQYRIGGKPHLAAIGPGFVEAEPDKVLVLTDLFATPDEIDPEEVEAERVAAEKALAEFGQRHEGPEYLELQRDIDWAVARLTVHKIVEAM